MFREPSVPVGLKPVTKDANAQEIARWKDLIVSLPDVREEKVTPIKQALSDSEYDAQGALDETVERLVALLSSKSDEVV